MSSGNTFGKIFRLTSFGESHSEVIGGIIDGCPAGLMLSEADLQTDLDRRKPGASFYTSQRREPDRVKILSGVYEGKTLGTPIGIMIHNENQRSSDYDDLKTILRPGHGDYTYFKKYGHRDHRGGGRASARETAIRVAAGAIAKKFLHEKVGLTVRGYLAQIGPVVADTSQFSWDTVSLNEFHWPQANQIDDIATMIERLRKDGDSIGARITVVAENVPVGLGEPVFDRLDADIAKALMSIPAVKGIEIGDGFAVVNQKGSMHRDPITPDGFVSNHAGGILAGISNGEAIVASIAIKPTSSIRQPIETINIAGETAEVVVKGRHDPCVGLRAVPIAEAMLALVLMDHYLQRDPAWT